MPSTEGRGRRAGRRPRADRRPCEAALGQTLPRDLAELLGESDGVEGEYGLRLIWPVKRIRTDNMDFRAGAAFATLYMPFEPLLFFADAGNGDQFAFVMRERPADVFVWDHETDSRTMVAPSLAAYLEWWLNRKNSNLTSAAGRTLDHRPPTARAQLITVAEIDERSAAVERATASIGCRGGD